MNIQRQLLSPFSPAIHPVLIKRTSTVEPNITPTPPQPSSTDHPLPPGPLDAPLTKTWNRFIDIPSHENPRYTNKAHLVDGANSTIFQAFDTNLNRSVVIKSFDSKILAAKTPQQRDNLRAVSRVQHSHVVTTYDLENGPTGSSIIMEYIRGENLETSVTHRIFDLERFLRFARQSLEGLLSIHRSGVLHLGIKSANLMLATQGAAAIESAKIVGFSRAQIIDPHYGNIGHIIGPKSDIRCTAPEQLSCSLVNQKTDLYALGCCFYYAPPLMVAT